MFYGKWESKMCISTVVFSNDFDSYRDGNLCKTVLHLVRCKTVVMKWYPMSYYERVHNIIVILQNCINLLEVVPGSCSETCYDRNQVINIKVEETAYVQEVAAVAPVPITLPVIKAEHEVSCFWVCIAIHTSQISSIVHIVFLISTLGNGI
jgi:hypothetical protein